MTSDAWCSHAFESLLIVPTEKLSFRLFRWSLINWFKSKIVNQINKNATEIFFLWERQSVERTYNKAAQLYGVLQTTLERYVAKIRKG